MQQDKDAQRLAIRRIAQATHLTRYRYALPREPEASGSRLSYALLIVILFQTFLLSCIMVFLGVLLFLNLSNWLYRPTDGVTASAYITPSPANPLSPLVVAAPTMPAAAEPQPDLPVAPTVVSPPTPEATVAAVSPLAPPTATLLPSPTAPPADNPPAQANVSPEIQAYANQVSPLLDHLAGALASLATLAQNLNLTDPQWVAQINTQLGIVQTSQDQLQAIQPPPAAQGVHSGLLSTTSVCRTGADILSVSIANNNASNLTTAQPYIQSCAAQFPEAANRVREWLRTRTSAP